ncbi:MAG: hypothetical protein AVDCRST_MAG91-92, partial [uncultured Sphingomonadaceae bacterium]
MTNRSQIARRRVPFLAVSSLAAMTAAGAAQAQTATPDEPSATEAAQAADPAASEQLGNEDIIVTGTRVVRNGYQAPTPLTVLSEEDIEN